MNGAIVRLRDVIEINPATRVNDTLEKDVRFVAMADVSETGRITNFQTRPLLEVSKGYTSFLQGDVLLAKITPCFENGKAAVVEQLASSVGFGSTEFHVLRPSSKIDEKFLFHLIWNPRFRRLGAARMTGSAGQKRLPTAFLAEYEFSLPQLAEQKRIAAILDKADSVRRKRQETIRRTDELLRALFIDMYGDPSKNPKGWPVLRMGDVIDFKGGSQPPKDHFIDEPRPGYVRLVQIRDFKTDRYKTYIPESLAKRSFEVDDVMIARYGPPVFQILRGLSGSYNVALMKAQPRQNALREFIFWMLQLPKYQQAVVSNSERTAGQTGVNLDFLNALEVPLPPISYQNDIARMTQRISSLISKQRQLLDACNSQVAALQSRFFD